MKTEKKRRRSVIVVILELMLVVVLMALVRSALFRCQGRSKTSPFEAGEFAVCAQSDSPDGRYRCLVLRRKQPIVGSAAFDYKFVIVDVASGRPLRGDPFRTTSFGGSLGEFQFRWNKDELMITPTRAAYLPQVRVSVRGDQQTWLWGSGAPSTREALDANEPGKQGGTREMRQ